MKFNVDIFFKILAKENFKDFLRGFKFYKFIKNFEKKYIRRNKNK